MELHERIASVSTAVPASSGGRDPFAEVKNRIHLLLVSELGPQLFDVADHAQARERAMAEIRRAARSRSRSSRAPTASASRAEISDDVFGYGPLEQLIADPSISEIMVNGHSQVWIERDGKITQTDIRFADEAQLRRIITKMVGQVGRRIDESSPMVDARLPDGSRVNAIVAPLSLSGPLLTIRRFSAERFDLAELVGIGTMSQQSCDFLCACVQAELSILISGGTGTGKTTMLNALSAAVPDRDRIVTIEDAAELQLKQRHTLRLESRPKNIEGEGEITIRDLVRNALRMRPDRIIVGEVRGAEALDMLQAMNTGHEGSLSTIHANSPRDALSRLETMVLMAGYDLPLRAIRHNVASALDLIVQIERLDDGTRHVTAISEVQRMEGEVITLQPLFEFKLDHFTEDGKVVGDLAPDRAAPGVPAQVQAPRHRAARRALRHAGARDVRDRARRPDPVGAGGGRQMRRLHLIILALLALAVVPAAQSRRTGEAAGAEDRTGRASAVPGARLRRRPAEGRTDRPEAGARERERPGRRQLHVPGARRQRRALRHRARDRHERQHDREAGSGGAGGGPHVRQPAKHEPGGRARHLQRRRQGRSQRRRSTETRCTTRSRKSPTARLRDAHLRRPRTGRSRCSPRRRSRQARSSCSRTAPTSAAPRRCRA